MKFWVPGTADDDALKSMQSFLAKKVPSGIRTQRGTRRQRPRIWEASGRLTVCSGDPQKRQQIRQFGHAAFDRAPGGRSRPGSADSWGMGATFPAAALSSAIFSFGSQSHQENNGPCGA